jgi:hypothetical protein
MTCEEQFKSRTSQAYKDCVAQRKAEELKLAKGLDLKEPEVIELDEVVVEDKLVKKRVSAPKIAKINEEGLEIIEDDENKDNKRDVVEKASYLVNSFSPFTVNPDSSNFWQDTKTWMSDLENTASTLANITDIAAETAGNVLKLENLKFENLKGEKEAFRVIGENLNSNNYEEINIPTYNAVQKLAVEQLIFKKKQNLTASELNDPENYMPTAIEIWAETNFLFKKALPYASQEKTTIVDISAQALDINPNNEMVDYISDFYGYARNGWLIGDQVQPVYDMFNSVGDDQTLANARNYIAKNANTIALNYTSDEYLKFQEDIIKNVKAGDGNWWSITKALYDNPDVLLTTGLQSLTMNASNVINAEGARERGFEASLEGAASMAGVTKNPYTTGVGAIAGFGAGTMEFLELNMTAMETLDELIREEGLGESIADLTEDEILDLLGDKKKMKEVLRISKNRSKIISAGTFLTAMLSFGTGKIMTAKGISTLKTLATLGVANVPAEMAIEALALQAQGKDLKDVKSVEEVIMEGMALNPTSGIASIASTTKAVNQSNINRKAKKIAVENGFSLADVFSGKANGTGVEIIKTGIDQGQMQLSLSSLIQSKEITINEAKEILTNFNDLKTFVGQTKDLVKKFGFNDSQTARISEILSELKDNQKLINQYKDAPALTAPLVKANAELNKELDSIIATGGVTEGIELEEVVVTGEDKKEQSIRGKKIDSLVGERKKDGKYKIKRKEWYNPKTQKGKSEEAIADIFTQNDPVTNQPGLLNSIIASKITFQMEQLPNFSKEDFISQTITELIPHIRNFNPEKNDSLNGWIIPQINNKIKNALKGGKSGTKEKFESSIQSGSVEGKEIQIEDDSTQEGIDAEVQTEPIKVIGDMLADIAGVDSETTSAAASQTIKSPIEIEKKGSPRQAVKDVSAIGKAKFYEMVMEAFGGPLGTKDNKIGNFTTFLEANGVNILRILENEDGIKNNQLAGLYGPKKVGRATGKFDKGAGKGVFTYNNPKPTTQDLVNFLTDPNTGMTTLRNRQEKFADIIAGLLNRAKTKELGDTKEGGKILKETQSIVNPDVPEAVEKILSQIDIVVKKLDATGKNQLGSGVSPALIANLLSGGLKLLKSGIRGTVSLAQALGRLKRTIAAKAKNSTLADIITRYFVDKATTGKINEINESSVGQILTEFAVVTGNVNVLLTKYDQAKTYDLKSKTNINNYIADIKKNLLPLMPRRFWFGKKDKKGKFGTQFTGSSKLIGTSITDKKLYKYFESEVKKLNNDNQEFGPPILDKEGKEIDFSVGGYSTLFGTPGKARLNIGNNKIADFNKKIGLIHKELWKRTFTAIKDNPKEATVIANYMKGVGSNTRHWHKMGAQLAGYSDVMTDGVVFEHAMPATAAYIYLLDAALSGKDFTTEYGNIIKNYKLIALSKKNDDKINKVRYDGKAWLKTRMNPGWLVETGKWYDRYFNNLVADIDGGIDPNSIIMLDGRTLAETFDIKTSQGRPEAVIIDANAKSADKIAEGQNAVENNPDLIPKQPVDLSKEFNVILEETKGIGQEKVYSDIGARKSGTKSSGFKFFMPPSAQDFELLMYNFLGKGKLGEKQKRFFVDNLMKPYSKGIAKMEIYRAQLMNDFESLKKLLPEVSKKLGDKIKGLDYTNSQAIRVFLWDKSNFDIPGISKTDKNKLISFVKKNPDLIQFAEGLTALSKQPEWVKPNAYWDTGSIIQDVNRLSSTVGRKQQLEQFIKNADIIFSKENLNKIEAVYGVELKEALQDILYRMKNGTNRPSNADRLTNAFTNWLNNAVGAIMFFNRRSATLQLLSMLNYVNAQENNPLAIAKTVLNVKQYGKDIYTILSSPKIKKRFAGEGRGVNEAEISSAVSTSTNKTSALLSYLLKVGFTPTRAADATAIALGGASYYRNKINAYKKEGLSDKDAEAKAWEDFSDTTEKFQQSSDPMLISQQQASVLGRFILAFQNTPMQYTRSMVKDGKDLINRRRVPGLTQSQSDQVYISRIIYYGAVQNFMFAALQNALFALVPGFDDEGEELDEKEKLIQNKQIRIVNNMLDTILRGSGIYGAIASTLKNVATKYFQEEGKTPFSKDHRNTLIEILNLSPPVGSKIRKINNSLKIKDYDKDVIEKRGWDVMLDGKINLSPSYSVLGNVVEGVTNLPLARFVDEVNILAETLDSRNTSMQRIALGLGWRTWDVGVDNEEHDLIKLQSKENREAQRKQKVIDDRAEKLRLKELEKYKGKTKEEIKRMKRRDSIVDTNKSDQVKSLINLGLTKKEIKELKYEDDRVNKIIELTNK